MRGRGGGLLLAFGLGLLVACGPLRDPRAALLAPGGPPSPEEALARRHAAEADTLERQGALRAALDELMIALTITPADEALRTRARALTGRIQGAAADHLRRGQRALDDGDRTMARSHFLAVLALRPGDLPALQALRDSTPPEAAGADDRPEDHPLLADAAAALARHDHQEALAAANAVLAGNPRSPEARDLKALVLYQLGRQHLARQDYEPAYRALSELARLAPGYEDAALLLQQARSRLVLQHYRQGLRYYREERLEEAIAAWRQVLALDPRHVAAAKNIEQAERILRKLEERLKK